MNNTPPPPPPPPNKSKLHDVIPHHALDSTTVLINFIPPKHICYYLHINNMTLSIIKQIHVPFIVLNPPVKWLWVHI